MFHVKHLCIIKNLQLAPYIILAKKIMLKNQAWYINIYQLIKIT